TPAGPVNVGTLVRLQVLASDNVRVVSPGLTIDGEPLLVGPDGTATRVMNALGSFLAVASARDPAGNTGAASLAIEVMDPAAANQPTPGDPGLPPNPGIIDPSDTKPPVVKITSPQFETRVTDRTPIKGTVDDPEDRLWYYRVMYARVDAVDLTNLDVS